MSERTYNKVQVEFFINFPRSIARDDISCQNMQANIKDVVLDGLFAFTGRRWRCSLFTARPYSLTTQWVFTTTDITLHRLAFEEHVNTIQYKVWDLIHHMPMSHTICYF